MTDPIPLPIATIIENYPLSGGGNDAKVRQIAMEAYEAGLLRMGATVSETRRVTYEKFWRDKAKEQNKPLFTVDIPGYLTQGLGDQQLIDDLATALSGFNERRQASKKAAT